MAVRVEEVAFGDARFAALGELSGYNEHEALGRMLRLWRYCTQRGTYHAPEAIIRACLGPRGVEALLDSDLAERTDQGVRVRGTKGRVEWLEEARDTASSGGKVRAATAERGPDGRMLPRQTGESTQRNPADRPAGEALDQPAGASGPAVSSALVTTLVIDRDRSPARARDEEPPPLVAEVLDVDALEAEVRSWGWTMKADKHRADAEAMEGQAVFTGDEVLEAREEALKMPGNPSYGLLIAKLKYIRAQPESRRVARREAQAQAPPRKPKPKEPEEKPHQDENAAEVIRGIARSLP